MIVARAQWSRTYLAWTDSGKSAVLGEAGLANSGDTESRRSDRASSSVRE